MTTTTHCCADNADLIGTGSHPYECVVCGKRLCALDLDDPEGE